MAFSQHLFAKDLMSDKKLFEMVFNNTGFSERDFNFTLIISRHFGILNLNF